MTLSKNIKIYTVLPTERYLKKFLDFKVKINPTYTLSNKDQFGKFVYVCLTNGNYKVELNDKKFNDKIKIEIPIAYEKLQKDSISAENIHLINSFLKTWFYEDFFSYMRFVEMFGLRIDKTIESFCSIYDISIDIDINYETLKKAYYRWKQRNGQPLHKFLIKIVQNN